VVDFLEYVKYRWMVAFRKLDDPKARPSRCTLLGAGAGGAGSLLRRCPAACLHNASGSRPQSVCSLQGGLS